MCFYYEIPEKLKKNKKLEENMEIQPELEQVEEKPLIATAS